MLQFRDEIGMRIRDISLMRADQSREMVMHLFHANASHVRIAGDV